MKKEALRFMNQKRTPKNTRGSKDLWWKKMHNILWIRNAPLKMQGTQKTSDEKEALHFTNQKRTPKNTRGSKDLWWKKRHRVSRIRNSPLKTLGA
jgi:hypothetical protein